MEKPSWHSKEETPIEGKRVLTFSPAYPIGHDMRFRIVDGQFVRIMLEVSFWLYLDEIEPENK